MKLKIKPSAKIKRRYFLLQGGTRGEVEKVILDYIGILGWAKGSCVFAVGKGVPKGKVVLVVAREAVNDVRASFEIADTGVTILKVSGTLKGLL
jgi:RNase P/RNase MRP subunit POP5